jgi:hypothetical protein
MKAAVLLERPLDGAVPGRSLLQSVGDRRIDQGREMEAQRLDPRVDRLAPAPDDFGRPAGLIGRQLRAVVAAPAVHQVVDLVDHQDDVRKILVRGEARQRDVGIENVVVIADRHLHPA